MSARYAGGDMDNDLSMLKEVLPNLRRGEIDGTIRKN